jgi:AbrB family looped-hinge helix DNA binding protein
MPELQTKLVYLDEGIIWRVLTEKCVFPTVGLLFVGKMTEVEVIIDEKGRILIPKEAREKLRLQAGGKARLKIDKEKIVITPPVSPEEFIEELEGCIKEGTPAVDPLDLKKMWEPKIKQAKN